MVRQGISGSHSNRSEWQNLAQIALQSLCIFWPGQGYYKPTWTQWSRGYYPINGIFIPVPHCHGGYLAFDNGVPSDHCGLWLDLPLQLVCPIMADQPLLAATTPPFP